jgi:hypothetical protein
MNDDFILGFVNSMEGEKDPRNLLSAFQIMRTIIREFDITKHAEVGSLSYTLRAGEEVAETVTFIVRLECL